MRALRTWEKREMTFEEGTFDSKDNNIFRKILQIEPKKEERRGWWILN
jgi:hypothetical protein